MLKAGGNDVILFMTELFNTIFDNGIYPSELAIAIILPIHKRGNMHLVDKYRGVSLLTIVSNCFILLKENSKIVEMPTGFRGNCSTTDQTRFVI